MDMTNFICIWGSIHFKFNVNLFGYYHLDFNNEDQLLLSSGFQRGSISSAHWIPQYISNIPQFSSVVSPEKNRIKYKREKN